MGRIVDMGRIVPHTAPRKLALGSLISPGGLPRPKSISEILKW